MSGNKIRFLSASDRINYGDLLFPIIFKKFLIEKKIDLEFHNYGLVKSNLNHFGALKTKSFRRLEKEISENDKVIIGGGEVFFANWTKLYSYINPLFKKLLKSYRFNKLNKKYNFSKLLLSSNKIMIPFCFSAVDFNLSSLNVYYSSVGGGTTFKNDAKSKYIIKSLKNAKKVSLRDKRSMSYFSNIQSIKSILVPDTALLMSKYFNENYLKTKKSINNFDFKYIFVQMAINKGPNDLKDFVNKLTKISNKFNAKIVLCPIGLAFGHEDHIILKKINNHNKDFIYVHPQNLYDIMYLISNSFIYLGTSLHGAITAMSYNIPFIGLNKNVNKLESYAQTWISNDYLNVNFEDLNEDTITYYINLFLKHYSREIFENQTKLIEKNLESILYD